MMERTASTNGDPRARADAQPNVRAFAMAHKRFSFVLLAVIVVFVAVVLPAILGPGRLSDSSSCSTWDSADHAEQAAYARRYLREHGALFSGATTPQGVASAITAGCAAAAVNDEADTVSVIQAIEGRY
jgi:hypothetical protein